jgi:glycosyltransferase involved in cell wall biosynthesis
LSKFVLGYHYHFSAVQRVNQLFMPGYQGRFVDSLAQFSEEIVCYLHTPCPENDNYGDYRISSNNVRYINIGYHKSVPYRTIHNKKYLKIIEKNVDNVNCLIVRSPTALAPFFESPKLPPIVFLIVGDMLAGINDLPQKWWRKELIRLYWNWNIFNQDKIAKKTLTFVNSHLLYEKYKDKFNYLEETHTTTLNLTDFYFRNDSFTNSQINILYTGRLDTSKGLFDILDLLKYLIEKSEQVIFNFAGWESNEKGVLKKIMEFAKIEGLEDNIIYHGYKSVGPELNELYRNADLFINASKSTEGFPRTIWEAMANSCPVIATKVGSIPFYLEDKNNAILADPNNVKSLIDSYYYLKENIDERRNIISNAYKLAKENTLENRTREMMQKIKVFLSGKNRL